jgi:hypothetical protein
VTKEAVVVTDNSSTTESVRVYGEIDSLAELRDFVLDIRNQREDEVSINVPSTLNSDLMHKMTSDRNTLDRWQAPDSVEVYEVVGWGLPTIKSFSYREFSCKQTNPACVLRSIVKPFPIFTSAGDKTVVAASAEAYEGDKIKAVVNLANEGAQFFVREREHYNLTESPAVQEFLESVIKYPYLAVAVQVPEFIEVSSEYTIIGTHSPVEVTVKDVHGNKVGRQGDEFYEDIDGSSYFEIGGSAYVVVPKTTTYEVSILGLEDGVYSLTIDTLEKNNIQKNEYTYSGATTTSGMIARFTASSSGFSTIQTDYNQDGVVDLEQTLDGIKVEEVVSSYSYDDLLATIRTLQINKKPKQILLIETKLAQALSVTPRLEKLARKKLIATIALFVRIKILTKEQQILLETIINNIR